ncbi:hypothetical protein N5U23_10810, partial [Aliarcobacter butzleri]|uniref:hypothetical protein n=1 Tax=Aliarcobacter butzleri TaxID=28197 RepID=UPI0021B36F64
MKRYISTIKTLEELHRKPDVSNDEINERIAVFPDFVDFLIKKVRIPIIKALRLFLSHFWVTHVIIVHVCKKKNK